MAWKACRLSVGNYVIMVFRMLTASCLKSVIKMPEHEDKNTSHLTNNCCLSNRWKGTSAGQKRLQQTAGLALLLISDLSDGCTDHLPFLVLAGSAELYRNREISQSTTCSQFTCISCFFPLLIPFWWAHRHPVPTEVFLPGCPTARQILTWKRQRRRHQSGNISRTRIQIVLFWL